MVTWSECQDDFERTGSFLDVYVLDGSLAAWNALLEIARKGGPRFIVDCEEASPMSVEEAFAASSSAAVALGFEWQGLVLTAHFFAVEEVTLCFWPEEITDQRSLDALCSFLSKLAVSTNREAIVTDDGAREAVILRASPSGDVIFEPSPPAR